MTEEQVSEFKEAFSLFVCPRRHLLLDKADWCNRIKMVMVSTRRYPIDPILSGLLMLFRTADSKLFEYRPDHDKRARDSHALAGAESQ